jgi:hypothetical protein
LPPKPLREIVSVSRRFQRSIRVDSDFDKPHALEGFVCPESSATALVDLARHVQATRQGAFTWTGPYGAGKSSLAVAFAGLLSGQPATRRIAREVLSEEVATTLLTALRAKSQRWCCVPIVGRRASLFDLLTGALQDQRLIRLGGRAKWNEAELLSRISRISEEKGGLLILVDELGKVLEHAVKGDGDVHLFQQLAELANRSNGKLLLVGLLHQGVADYASRASSEMRDELSKVQGRFVDLLIAASPDEQLDLLSRAIEVQADAPVSAGQNAKAVAQEIRQSRPGNITQLAATLLGCWPLHPIASALLAPISRRRFAQNQRSIFGFLTSAEPFAFSEFIQSALSDQVYEPDRLWAYLRSNLEPAILSSPDSHRWATAAEAVERCEARLGDSLALKVAKTVALIDMFRDSGSGLFASPKILRTLSLKNAELIDAALDELTQAGILSFRQRQGTYVIASGSDFDLEAALSHELSVIPELKPEELQRFFAIRPILAKRFYHEHGALYWATLRLLPASKAAEYRLQDAAEPDLVGQIAVLLPTQNESTPTLRRIARAIAVQAPGQIAFGISKYAHDVVERAREVICLERIASSRSELRSDAVARREVDARLLSSRDSLTDALDGLLESAEWFRGENSPIKLSHRQLSQLASDFAETKYPSAPRWRNELLNRRRPSSNAMAALRLLLHAMVLREGDFKIGLEGFSAESGLFHSLILPSGTYRETKDGLTWCDLGPTDPCRLRPAWDAATHLLSSQDESLTLDALYRLWSNTPFGIKPGLLPILAFVFVLANRGNLAWYRDGVFQTRLTDLDVDLVLQDPNVVSLRWISGSAHHPDALRPLAEVAAEVSGRSVDDFASALSVARALVGAHDQLPNWSKRTLRVTTRTAQVRQILRHASDPHQLLFFDLPGVTRGSGGMTPKGRAEVASTLREALLELRSVQSKMLSDLRRFVSAELQFSDDDLGASAIRQRAETIRDLSGDLRLNSFVLRLSTFRQSEPDIEGLVALAINKPARDWTDNDLSQAKIELADLCQKFLRTELFARVQSRAPHRQALGLVVGGRNSGETHFMEVQITEADEPTVERISQALGKTLLAQHHGRSVAIAALARVATALMEAKD